MVSPKTDSVKVRIDASPLIEALNERNMLREVERRTLEKWRTIGIDIYWADKWSVKIGMHPYEIFGMEFYASDET